MSGFNPFDFPGPSDPFPQPDRVDDLCSQSGSDDGSGYNDPIFSEICKGDTDPEGAFCSLFVYCILSDCITT